METAAAPVIEVTNPATGLVIGSVPKQGRLEAAKAVDGLIASKYRNAGQTCICTNRIFVHEACAAAFTEKLAAFRLTVLLGPVYLRAVGLLLMQRDRVPF